MNLIGILKMAANTYLRNRAAGTGRKPGRLPPTSAGEARNRAVGWGLRTIMDRLMGGPRRPPR